MLKDKKSSISIAMLLGKGKPSPMDKMSKKHSLEEDDESDDMDDEMDSMSEDEQMAAEQVASALGLSNVDTAELAEALRAFVKACGSSKY